MCIILDTNRWGEFLNNQDDMKPIHTWLKKQNGKLIYSNHDKFEAEFNKAWKYKNALLNYSRAGKVRMVEKEKVVREMEKMEKVQLKSNDEHILALAKASGVKVLCSLDQDLHQDFKKIIGGNIYQNKEHKQLLTKDTCP